jgi:5-methylcytosine-specific restriction endonuclease McrA
MRDRQGVLAVLILRDRARCNICGCGEANDDPWTIDHVLPRKRKGGDELSNLQLAHASCNSRKGTNLVASYSDPWWHRDSG